MAILTATYARAWTDKMTAAYLAELAGQTAVLAKTAALEALFLATADSDTIDALLPASRGMNASAAVSRVSASLFTQMLRAYDGWAKKAGVSLGVGAIVDLDSFATYYNLGTGGTWTCLFAPDFWDLMVACGVTPSAWNTYFEVLQGATYTNALFKHVYPSTDTDGVAISTVYAGGLPQAKCSSVTGTGTLSVVGTWRKTDGSTATGTGTLVNPSNASLPIVPPFTNALLLDVTSVTHGTLTGGTYYIEATKPADSPARVNPPT